MRVISLKSNTKLIKGCEYIADSFNNTPTGNRWGGHRISIRGYGGYQCKNFTDVNGEPLPEINYINPNRVIYERTYANSLNKNDIIVCNSDRYKYLVKGGKYRIVDTDIRSEYSANMKLEGYNRWIKWNSWSFRKLSLQETRDLALSQIFDQPENFSVEFIRKFDKEQNQIKILLQTIAKSILDPYRHELDVIDWGIHKEKYQKLTREDFQDLLNKPLSEILELYQNSFNS
jgi:hypothetical protein